MYRRVAKRRMRNAASALRAAWMALRFGWRAWVQLRAVALTVFALFC